jgi:uncharacterized RDD family membrane protein YckC
VSRGPQVALTIRTPEGITFSQPLASPIVRFLAWFVDGLIKLGLLLLLHKALVLVQPYTPDLSTAIDIALGFLVFMLYGILLEWRLHGQTVGKRVLRLRVSDAEGLHLTVSQIVIRNVVSVVDALPLAYLVGGAACMISPRCQRLGDLAAGTVVLRIPRFAPPDLAKVLGGKFNSMRQHAHLGARLRQLVSPEEASLAFRATLRREAIDPDRRVELFDRLAEHFQALVQFPQEATEGLTSEQYVRNVVDILFQARESRRPAKPAAARA